MKKSIHANLKNSNFHNKNANLNYEKNQLSIESFRDLSENWKSLLKNFDLNALRSNERRLILEFTNYFNDNFSIFLVFSTRFAFNFSEFESVFIEFKKKLDKSGNCLICAQFYKGLKTHFLSCFNRIFKNFIFNFLSNQATSSDEQVDDIESLPFFNSNDDELGLFFSPSNFILNDIHDQFSTNNDYLTQLASFCDPSNLNILHLNINSVEHKLINLESLLSAKLYDILVISESKLDFTTSKKFGKGYGYQILRRDRNAHGGGLIVFINGKLKLLSSHNSTDFELIHFQLQSSKVPLNFICTYKPPNKVENNAFFTNLEDYIFTLDPNQPLLIIGDLNEDLLCDKGKDLKQFIDQYSLSNCISKPTRIKACFSNQGVRISQSLIDVCLHNNVDQFGFNLLSDVIGCPFSDHSFICVSLRVSCEKAENEAIYGRNLNPDKIKSIVNQLNQVDFGQALKFKETYRQWGWLKNKILFIINSQSPIKRLKKSKKQKNNFVHYDKELLLVAKQRDFLYTVATSLGEDACPSQKEASWKNYVEYRQKFDKLLKLKTCQSIESQFSNGFKDSRSRWKFYSNFINTKKSESEPDFPEFLIENGVKVDNRSEMPDYFNSFFTSIVSNSFSDQSSCTSFIDQVFMKLKRKKKVNIPGFTFGNYTSLSVIKAINELSITSSPGVSGIPTRILKEIGVKIAPVLAEIFNNCISSGIIPDEWKTAVVTPLFKNKGQKEDLNSYRGISVLPPINKVFEILISNKIRDYFESNGIFSSAQHGFRKNFSCETALHELISDLNLARDKNKITLLLFIDFKKAFDTVDSELLIRKLFHYGFDNQALSLIRNYFFNRKQFVKMGSNVSNYKKIKLGVPQGSVLGPLFFLIFINDLPFCLNELRCKLFADDTTIYQVGEDLKELTANFNKLLVPFFHWCELNRLDINWSKTYSMIVTNKRIKGLRDLKEIKIGNTNVQVVDKFKLLGVSLDCKLNFEHNVSQLRVQVNRKLYSIKRLFYLPLSMKIQFFKTFIVPIFDYCSTLLIYYSKQAIQKLANGYYLCIYKLFKLTFNTDDYGMVNIELKKLGIFNLHHRIVRKLGIFVFKINYFKNPPNLATEFKFNYERNIGYSLRNSNNLTQPKAERKFGELTFGFFFSKFINMCFLDKFNVSLKEFKVDLLKNLDFYVSKTMVEFEKLNFFIKFLYFF